MQKAVKHMDKPIVLPVILAGGSGERLWPLSRTAYPKQFLTLLGAKHSLFQETMQRLVAEHNYLAPLIICHEDYRFITAEQLRQIDCHTSSKCSGILLEPAARNTAPAIALAAQWAQQNHPDCILLVLPADHLIADAASFIENVNDALESAQAGAMVTFGIPVSSPETGYGYINVGPNNKVIKFIEKPDLAKAQEYCSNPDFLWNSGMFLFKATTYLQELMQYNPQVLKHSEYIVAACKQDLDFIRPNLPLYSTGPSISIDYAVMEHTKNAMVFALNSKWSDIGNWHAVWEQSEKDNCGNYVSGDVIVQNSNNCLLDARHRLVATMNVDDLIVIETSDAVLVAKRDQSQELKKIVAELKSRNHPAAIEHRQVSRPWGAYDAIAKGQGFQVKLITVQPGKSLSLQLHKYRSEHWIVVRGRAKVVRGDETFNLHENEATFIPLGVKHQLANLENTVLELIEVQSGSYLGEDDIIRFADEHGRATVSALENV